MYLCCEHEAWLGALQISVIFFPFLSLFQKYLRAQVISSVSRDSGTLFMSWGFEALLGLTQVTFFFSPGFV